MARHKKEAPTESTEIKSDTVTYQKSSGTLIEINNTEGNRQAAEAAGWKLVK